MLLPHPHDSMIHPKTSVFLSKHTREAQALRSSQTFGETLTDLRGFVPLGFSRNCFWCQTEFAPDPGLKAEERCLLHMCDHSSGLLSMHLFPRLHSGLNPYLGKSWAVNQTFFSASDPLRLWSRKQEWMNDENAITKLNYHQFNVLKTLIYTRI